MSAIAASTDARDGTAARLWSWCSTRAGVAPFLVLFGLFYVVPIVYMCARSLTDPQFGLENYRTVFSQDLYVKTLVFTLWFSALQAIACLVIGYPVALLLAFTSGWARKLLMAGLLLPFWVSLLVRTYAWVVIFTAGGPFDRLTETMGLGDLSILYTRTGVFVAMLHILLPYVVFVLYPVVRDIDPSLANAAQSLGASTGRVIATVYLPLSVRAMVQSLTLAFVMAIGFFVTPAILGGGKVNTLPMLVDTLTQSLLKYGLAAALAVVLVAVIAVLLFAARRRLALAPSAFSRSP